MPYDPGGSSSVRYPQHTHGKGSVDKVATSAITKPWRVSLARQATVDKY